MSQDKKKQRLFGRTEVIVALITVVGVLGTALLANWDKIFQPRSAVIPAEAPTNASSTSVQVPTSAITSDEEDEVTVNFASVDTATAPGHEVAADPYLLAYEIVVSDRTPAKSKIVIVNNLALYGGQAVHPSTTQNFLTQLETDNAPASFTLSLRKRCEVFTFTRPALIAVSKNGITHPAWSAHATDQTGRELSSQSEGIIQSLSNISARTYTLLAPGFQQIAAVRFDSDPRSDGKPFSAFSTILIERLTMKCKSRKQGEGEKK